MFGILSYNNMGNWKSVNNNLFDFPYINSFKDFAL